MVKLDCFQNHCRTKLKPKDGYSLFWNYKKQVVNCYLEVLNINDKNENMNEGREKSECVSPAICNEAACTCFTNNSIIDWNVGFYEKQIKHYVAVQYMRDLKIRDNALFDSHNMFLVEIVQELSTTVFRESNEDLKLEYPWIASQELGKEINKKKKNSIPPPPPLKQTLKLFFCFFFYSENRSTSTHWITFKFSF